jgi:hypothetical protein
MTTAPENLAAELVAASQRLQPDGCCSTPEWRGTLCSYHEGYADGVDAAIAALAEAGAS